MSNKECIPNKTEDLNLNVCNLITGMNESKTLTKHVNVNVDLTEENITQSNGGIMINVYVNVKNMYVKEVMFGILLHVIVKMENILQVLWMIQQFCVMKL